VGERDDFAAFVESRWASLVRLSWGLAGDRHVAEDLAQATLQRLWPRWRTVSASGDPWPYTQRIAVSIYSNWRRRRWHGEIPTAHLPEDGEAGGLDDVLADARVARWLDELPAGQRSVVTLRFLMDLSVAEAARVLQVSPGAVKSQTAKALARLHTIATAELPRKGTTR
jgi:RNA polymerase sigma-70 factor (sigma-E family)